MFTVHFNKVRQIAKGRQIASNVLSFDLLPKQSIDEIPRSAVYAKYTSMEY